MTRYVEAMCFAILDKVEEILTQAIFGRGG